MLLHAAIEILVIHVHHILEERNIAVWYAAAAAGFYQTVQGITRILVEHTFHNKNLVTTSCGSHHAMLQCVGGSSTERGCKHEVQADKTSQVGQAAATHADDKGAASGQRRLCGRLLQDRQEPVCWIMRTTARPRRQRPRRNRWRFSGGCRGSACRCALPLYHTVKGPLARKAAAPLTSCGIAGTPQRQKGGLHHDSQH